MHPLIARYLSPEAARDTLQKEKDGAPLEPEERLFVQTANAHPDKRGILLGGKDKRRLSSDAEAAVIFLAAYAATRALAEDPTLAPATAKAREALAAEGASEDETDAFIASILMEEAFGYEQEVESFDSTYVQETLGEVPALAALSREQVDALIIGLERSARDEKERDARARVSRALVNVAWEEGPTPINPEHIEALYEAEIEGKPEAEMEAGLRATVDFLQVLAREGLIGPQRLSRLRAQLGDEEA
ncbi:hypothetical protein [Melittangium boletus]|uniref:Uncharacterized protein n=1 Tax=Melittangium boletus DSM 14713 TaxID=1294270 RepID=A0A250I8D0_9BACT|nr:hypothetical protein [Melittangium boletus]ATB27412.1 hypothetical protein MEBOL_000854 [Melittangium boletus DSM 14713]